MILILEHLLTKVTVIMKNKEMMTFLLMIAVGSILVQGVEKERNIHQEKVVRVMIGHLEKILPEMDIVQGKSLCIHLKRLVPIGEIKGSLIRDTVVLLGEIKGSLIRDTVLPGEIK